MKSHFSKFIIFVFLSSLFFSFLYCNENQFEKGSKRRTDPLIAVCPSDTALIDSSYFDTGLPADTNECCNGRRYAYKHVLRGTQVFIDASILNKIDKKEWYTNDLSVMSVFFINDCEKGIGFNTFYQTYITKIAYTHEDSLKLFGK